MEVGDQKLSMPGTVRTTDTGPHVYQAERARGPMSASHRGKFPGQLLEWYDENGRHDLPWRKEERSAFEVGPERVDKKMPA